MKKIILVFLSFSSACHAMENVQPQKVSMNEMASQQTTAATSVPVPSTEVPKESAPPTCCQKFCDMYCGQNCCENLDEAAPCCCVALVFGGFIGGIIGCIIGCH